MFKHILLPVDLQESAMSIRATVIAEELAHLYDAKISVMTVIPNFGMPVVASFFPEDTIEKAAREVLLELKRFVAAQFKTWEDIGTIVVEGSPHEEVLEVAAHRGFDLIIIPARAMDLGKTLLGSTSTQIVERSECSVMVVRP